MSVNNRLTKGNAEPKKDMVVYEANGMQVTLTPATVRNYLVSGNKEAVTFEELAMFMNLCKFNGLNPWIKEAYCIKYGNEPATMVVGKDAFMKRAESFPEYDGNIAGIIVMTEVGEVEYRNGSFTIKGDKIIGGFAEVWRKDRTHSTRIEVSFDEYAGRKKDGSLNSQWAKKPATMIRKVALVQALKEAFPYNSAGLYTAEEVGVDEPTDLDIPEQPKIIEAVQPQETPQQEQTGPEASGTVQPPADAQTALFGSN